MNATVSALPREEEVQTKIHKIRAFGRKARTVCTFLFWLVLLAFVAVAGILLTQIFTTHSPVTASGDGSDVYDILLSPITPLTLKLWTILTVAVGIGVWLTAMLQLRQLFGHLAAGEIYTPGNIRLVRNIGLLWLLLAVLDILLPATVAIANGFLHAPLQLDLDLVFPEFEEVLLSFATAALILLVSWIMDVGLYEKQHADTLRRDADLVI